VRRWPVTVVFLEWPADEGQRWIGSGKEEEGSLSVPSGVTAGAGVQQVPDSVEGLRYVETCGCYCPPNSPHSL